LDLLDSWSKHGVTYGVITDGPRQVLVRFQNEVYHVTPPTIDAVNPIGSGDSLLAGLTDGWLAGLEPVPLIRRAVACAVANALVWDAGAIQPEEVCRLESAIEVQPVSSL
jgi:fructose-1-phosphate kinase PfkB-like protein